ncbi:MAG TPA: hypothetical protein VFU02_23770, partial [Polyangiaceae bacterium]|nr:hypothetical protein [Polyangiaceae bacterium]
MSTHARRVALLLFTLLGSSLFACSRDTQQSRKQREGEPQTLGSKRQTIQNKGSDTLVNVAQTWAEAYAKLRPDTPIAV